MAECSHEDSQLLRLLVADQPLAEWCSDCGAIRFRSPQEGAWEAWRLHGRPRVRVLPLMGGAWRVMEDEVRGAGGL